MKKLLFVFIVLLNTFFAYTQEYVYMGHGSGFALNNGYVATNWHVVKDADKVLVSGINGDLTKKYNAKIVKYDTKNDLAVLKIEDDEFTGFGEIPYHFRNSECRKGTPVFALGYPKTAEWGNSPDEVIYSDMGAIKALNGTDNDNTVYMHSATINHGSSGGPLFSELGLIVGVTNAGQQISGNVVILDGKIKTTSFVLNDNVNYAIKIPYLKTLILSMGTEGESILPMGKTAELCTSQEDRIATLEKFVYRIEILIKKESINISEIANEIVSNNENTINGYEAVDLGLSVKWATCNLGANSPEQYGDFYAWGETTKKNMFTWNTYKWVKQVSPLPLLSKYNFNSAYGDVDNKYYLDPFDDVAHASMGGYWRMPTINEIKELMNNCTWRWVMYNGELGYVITSKINGNRIFLPAAGFQGVVKSGSADFSGGYWSKSLLNNVPYGAYTLLFTSQKYDWDFTSRFFGLPIRPVYGEERVSNVSTNKADEQITQKTVPLVVKDGKKETEGNSKYSWPQNYLNENGMFSVNLMSASAGLLWKYDIIFEGGFATDMEILSPRYYLLEIAPAKFHYEAYNIDEGKFWYWEPTFRVHFPVTNYFSTYVGVSPYMKLNTSDSKSLKFSSSCRSYIEYEDSDSRFFATEVGLRYTITNYFSTSFYGRYDGLFSFNFAVNFSTKFK